MFNTLYHFSPLSTIKNHFKFILSRFLSTTPPHLWNRNPGCRYPSKANHGARPDCRSLRKIRKRLRTGK